MFPGVPTPEAAAQAAKTARVLELAESGLTSGEISSQVGLSRRAAYQLARRHGRGVKSMARDSSESADAAVQDVLAGASATDAAIDAGISAETLRRRMRQMGVSARTNPAERRDGRVARAVARVLAGESVPAACQAEHCASSGVYTELEKHKKKRVLAR
jgi:transposase-like protein